MLSWKYIISLILFNIIIVSLPSMLFFMLAFLLFLLLILISNLIQLHLLYLYFHGLEINQIMDRLVELNQMKLLFHAINYNFLEQTLKYILITNFIRPSTLKLCLVIYIFNIYLTNLIFDLTLWCREGPYGPSDYFVLWLANPALFKYTLGFPSHG